MTEEKKQVCKACQTSAYAFKHISAFDQTEQTPKKYTKLLAEPWFSLVKLGLKTYEGRINQTSWKDIKEGDQINFFNTDMTLYREVSVVVVSRKEYSSFKEMLIGKINNFLPGIESLENAVKVYRQYFNEAESEHGVVGFEIKVWQEVERSELITQLRKCEGCNEGKIPLNPLRGSRINEVKVVESTGTAVGDAVIVAESGGKVFVSSQM